MIKLPTTPQEANPNKVGELILIGHQGSGKTSAFAGLPNSLLIDLENGSEQIGGNVINLKKESANQNEPMGKLLMETVDEIKKANSAKGSPVYDYIGIDGITQLAKLARQKATSDFKNSVMGKGMLSKGAVIKDVVTDVPESGWMWYFRAFDEIYTNFQGLAGKCLIFMAHSKQGSLMKDGVKLDAQDMNLERKLSLDLLRSVDACGMVYRASEHEVKISFKVNEKDLTIKARAQHLNNQEFTLTIMNPETKQLTYFWDKIFN